MVRVSLTGDCIRFEVQGWDKFWALKSQLEIPISHVTDVRYDPDAARGWWHGLRLPGTNIPGVVTAGTFLQGDGFVFYDVHDPDRTIVLDLNHETYKKLIIEVDDIDSTVSLIRDALRSSAR
jgi:hypothetical protein